MVRLLRSGMDLRRHLVTTSPFFQLAIIMKSFLTKGYPAIFLIFQVPPPSSQRPSCLPRPQLVDFRQPIFKRVKVFFKSLIDFIPFQPLNVYRLFEPHLYYKLKILNQLLPYAAMWHLRERVSKNRKRGCRSRFDQTHETNSRSNFCRTLQRPNFFLISTNISTKSTKFISFETFIFPIIVLFKECYQNKSVIAAGIKK